MKYLCDPQIIPTVVPSDSAYLCSYAEKVVEYAEWLHVDIADGLFAPNTTWPLARPDEGLDAFSRATLPPQLSLEAHLMAHAPLDIGSQFARAGFSRIIGHIEAFEDASEARDVLNAWRAAGAQEVGIAILLDTPVSRLEGAAKGADCILAMSIASIGTQGIRFDERALGRVEELHAMYPDTRVAVDGGVSEATVEDLVRAGANRLAVGSALSGSTNPAATYAQILERAQKGCMPVTMELPV